MTVSLIIPVYNTRFYLRRSIESVAVAVDRLKIACELGPSVVEAICVDDGSTDGSYDELCRLKKEFDVRFGPTILSIILIHQNNKGVSVARNVALDRAKGEWVAFLDADDKLSEDVLVRCFQTVRENPVCDAVVYGVESLNADGTSNGRWPSDAGGVAHTGREALFQGSYIASVCDKFFRKEVVDKNHLRFPVGMKIGEDTLFATMFMACANRIVSLIPYIGYFAFLREGSASTTKGSLLFEDPFRQFRELYAMWDDHYSIGLKRRLQRMAAVAPALGGCLVARSERMVAISFLLKSSDFNKMILPFMLKHGEWRSRLFAIFYFALPAVVLRKVLLYKVARFAAG